MTDLPNDTDLPDEPKTPNNPASFSCPVPRSKYDEILLAHGGGGRLTGELIEGSIIPRLGGPAATSPLHDGAIIELAGERICFTTDSFVVQPLVFPGGDIGSLAVHGTVNDVAMCGGEPRVLSLAFVLEEGFRRAEFERILDSVADASRHCDVPIVTGDTKVVERGKGDGVYVNTSGIGVVSPDVTVGPDRVREGDAVIVSGPLARHGMAVMSRREGLEFESEIQSDSAPLHRAVRALLAECPDVHCLRDPTRGGVASTLVEIAGAAGVGVRIADDSVPVPHNVRAACEILGLDPLYVANEGVFVVYCAADDAERVVSLLRQQQFCEDACRIGTVEATPGNSVVVDSAIGGARVLDAFSGEQLPRIC